jgi:20S proteasome alpha/beta subunit
MEVCIMNTIKGFIEALKKDKGYDYLANNYQNMSKDELERIALEFLYELTSETHEADINNAIEELEDFFSYEWEDNNE